MDNQQQLPLLSLSNDQKQIIAAHIGSDIQVIVTNQYRPDNEKEAIYQNIFRQGRINAFSALLDYDADQLKQATEIKEL